MVYSHNRLRSALRNRKKVSYKKGVIKNFAKFRGAPVLEPLL